MSDKRALFLLVALVFPACGKGDTCVPGATAACACPGGDTGAQTCLDDATFGACMCQSGSGGGGGGSGGGGTGGGGASTGGGSGNTGGGSASSGGGTAMAGPKRIFVTASTFNGNLGGLIGADSNCMTAAEAANLGGTWKAWISDSTTNAIDRISDVGPWFLVDGHTKVFNNKANLGTVALAAVNVNEQGMLSYVEYVWTGTVQAGHMGTSTFTNCNDWTDSNGEGDVGSLSTSGWSYLEEVGCYNHAALYCLEQ